MICNNIYQTALALIGEPNHSTGTADYEKRAPHLLGVIFHRLVRISEAITGTALDRTKLFIASLDEEFPLDERLFCAAALALASLFVLDELPELAAELDERADAEAELAAREAVSVTPTREVYP